MLASLTLVLCVIKCIASTGCNEAFFLRILCWFLAPDMHFNMRIAPATYHLLKLIVGIVLM